MYVERLIEQASRRVPAACNGQQQAAQPIDGLQILRQNLPSSFEASLYEPVLCLILQGGKQVAIGGRTLSFGPGECLLVSHDLPVWSAVTKAPYLALVFEVDLATVRELYGKVTESALESERAGAAQTHQADPGLLDALCRYLAL